MCENEGAVGARLAWARSLYGCAHVRVGCVYGGVCVWTGSYASACEWGDWVHAWLGPAVWADACACAHECVPVLVCVLRECVGIFAVRE